MSNLHVEQYQPQSSQDIARQRLAASRQEILLYTHLLQASLVVERANPLRQAAAAHLDLVRTTIVTAVLLLSVLAGLLAPQVTHALSIY